MIAAAATPSAAVGVVGTSASTKATTAPSHTAHDPTYAATNAKLWRYEVGAGMGVRCLDRRHASPPQMRGCAAIRPTRTTIPKATSTNLPESNRASGKARSATKAPAKMKHTFSSHNAPTAVAMGTPLVRQRATRLTAAHTFPGTYFPKLAIHTCANASPSATVTSSRARSHRHNWACTIHQTTPRAPASAIHDQRISTGVARSACQCSRQ